MQVKVGSGPDRRDVAGTGSVWFGAEGCVRVWFGKACFGLASYGRARRGLFRFFSRHRFAFGCRGSTPRGGFPGVFGYGGARRVGIGFGPLRRGSLGRGRLRRGRAGSGWVRGRLWCSSGFDSRRRSSCRGEAWQGSAGSRPFVTGPARQGVARQVKARYGRVWTGEQRRDLVWYGEVAAAFVHSFAAATSFYGGRHGTS